MFEELLGNNRAAAKGFELGELTSRPLQAFAVVTCMDCRIDPLRALGVRAGDAVVIRNAGARVTPDVLRSLALATTVLGVKTVAVMHHTGCALAFVDEATVRSSLAELGASVPIDAPDFLAMPDPDAALADDVNTLLEDEVLPGGVEVAGWRYDVTTGLIAAVIAPRTNR